MLFYSQSKIAAFLRFQFFCLGSCLIKQHCKNIEIYIEKEVVTEGTAVSMTDVTYYVRFTITIWWGFEADKIHK